MDVDAHYLRQAQWAAQRCGVAAKFTVFQTMTMPGDGFSKIPDDMTLDERPSFLDPGWPKIAFIERKLREDPTNWLALNRACVEAMLRSSGFDVRARIADECRLCETAHGGDAVMRRMIDEELVAAAGLGHG